MGGVCVYFLSNLEQARNQFLRQLPISTAICALMSLVHIWHIYRQSVSKPATEKLKDYVLALPDAQKIESNPNDAVEPELNNPDEVKKFDNKKQLRIGMYTRGYRSEYDDFWYVIRIISWFSLV